ncbi:MAG: restriction endonuclease subunit S [Rhodocyclaceae bacterium]|nr:restriction endonuclease subunit S [Rhodocyclaceae bacterium]
MTTWPTAKLGTVLRPIARAERVDAAREYRMLGARWYAQGLFVKERVLGQRISAQRAYRVESGDFVYNRLFAWKGSFALASDEVDGCYVSNEFPCFEIAKDRLEPAFLRWWFSQEVAWFRALGLSTGATPTSRNRLKEEDLLSLEIPLPPLPEQRRVVARVEEVAGLVAEIERLRLLSRLEQEALVVSLHLKLSGDRRRRLGDFLRLVEDSVGVATDASYPQVGVRSFGGGLFPKAAVEGGRTTYKHFNRLYDGALVMSQVKGWEGAVAVCPPPLAGWFVSPEYRTFRCIEAEANPGYLASLVRTEWFWGKLGAATRGVGARRERTRPEQFLSIVIPMPSLDLQLEAVRIVAELAPARDLQSESAAALDALLPAVLDRAFRGEL